LRWFAGSLAAGLGAGCRSRRSTRSDGRIEASLWFSYGGKNREVLLDLIHRFHEVQTRYLIRPVYQGDYFEGLAKLRTALYAGGAPALTHVVAEVVPYLADAGALLALDDFQGARELDLVPALAQEKTWAHGDRKPLYALPFNRSTPIAYYNRAVFAKAGVEPPSTWAELRQVARALTVRSRSDVAQWGFECPIDWWFWTALVGQAGGELIASDGTLSLGEDAGVRALTLWQDLVHRDRAMKPPPGRDYNAWQATNTDFLAGKAAMIWTSTAFLRYLEDNASFAVGAAQLPADVGRAVPTGGTFFVMPKSSVSDEEVEASWAFLRFMMEPDQANAWAMRTGYMPVSQTGLSELSVSGYYASHPNDRVAVDQLAHAMPWPWSRELFRLQREVVQPRLEEAVLAGRDARAVLAEARVIASEP
jgi:sn-glycerol 3-phosphate transport system substrate-binding protein